MSAIRYLLATLASLATLGSLTFATVPSTPGSLPMVARTSISAVVGRDDVRYHISKQSSGWNATNLDHKLTAHFDGKKLTLNSGDAAWGLALSHYGHGESRISPQTAEVLVKANRIEYRRGALTEWYVNGPVGVEQGFTFDKRPPASRSDYLTIAMKTGNLRADVDATRTGMRLIGNDGRAVLRYSGIEAYDANKKQLRAWIETHARELWLRVDDTRAQYPIVVDPIMQLGKITASDGSFSDGFGNGLAIGGNTIVVGAGGADGTIGAAYVFVKPATGWTTMTETAKLTPSDGAPEDSFGAVGVSGNTVIVGNAPCTGANSRTGKVYVYVEPPTGWVSTTETAQLSASNGKICNGLGQQVAISGNVVVTAGIGQNVPIGQVYVFVKPSTGWVTGTQTALLSSSVSDTLNNVAINQNTVVATANYENGKQQSADVFVMPSGGWRNMTQTARLTSSDWTLGDSFAFPAIFGDTVVVGDPQQNSRQGGAYVFAKPSTGWVDMTETAKLTASDGAPGDDFGIVATNGKVIAVGAGGAAIGGNSQQGAVYIYAKPSTGWVTTSTFTDKLSTSDGMAGDFFGSSVSINSNTLVGCDFTLACYVFGN